MTCLIDRVLGRDEVTYFYVGDVFVYTLALCMPIFNKKIFAEISGKKFQTFHCSNEARKYRPKYISDEPVGNIFGRVFRNRDCLECYLLLFEALSWILWTSYTIFSQFFLVILTKSKKLGKKLKIDWFFINSIFLAQIRWNFADWD